MKVDFSSINGHSENSSSHKQIWKAVSICACLTESSRSSVSVQVLMTSREVCTFSHCLINTWCMHIGLSQWTAELFGHCSAGYSDPGGQRNEVCQGLGDCGRLPPPPPMRLAPRAAGCAVFSGPALNECFPGQLGLKCLGFLSLG